MAGSTQYAFGPFLLDTAGRRLTRDGAEVSLAARHLDVLTALVARSGSVLTKDALIETAWQGLAVTDNSLEQAISALRRALTVHGDSASYIRTIPRQGYQFVAAVSRSTTLATDSDLDDLLAPHRAWVEGRAALETLSAEAAVSARRAFARALAAAPDDATAHIGMANAYIMRFEATRADVEPDGAALALAASHAAHACRLAAGNAEAWATQGFVLDRLGHSDDARAALARAVSLEPDNWRHHFRQALVSWGEARLRAARRALGFVQDLPLGHFLVATVHVARCALDDALQALDAGVTAMRAAADDEARFPGVALEWLRGAVLLSLGREDDAMEGFEREIAMEGRRHLYTREACANAWYACGAVRLRRGQRDEAIDAFRQASARAPRHPAAVALAVLTGERPAASTANVAPAATDLAWAEAVRFTMAEQRREAADRVAHALSQAPSGSQLWWLPVEPLLHVGPHDLHWSGVLTVLRNRAT